jgi:hypothetical protein
MRRRIVSGLCWSAAALVACADATAPPSIAPLARTEVREPTPEELESLSPEFLIPTSIRKHTIDGGYDNGTAWVTGKLEYFANWARETVHLQLFRGDATVGPMVAGVQEKTDLLPRLTYLEATVSVGVPANCGYRHNGHATAEIKNRVPATNLIWLEWAQRAGSVSRNFAQPQCPCTGSSEGDGTAATDQLSESVSFECQGTGGGGDGVTSGGSWVAVTTTTCYGTHYYDSNGRYLHSEIHYCISATSYYFHAAA